MGYFIKNFFHKKNIGNSDFQFQILENLSSSDPNSTILLKTKLNNSPNVQR